jgi:hypothetical protein
MARSRPTLPPKISTHSSSLKPARDEARAMSSFTARAVASQRSDSPGIRQGAAGQMYLAYLRDPDGNKIVGLHRVPG